MSAATKASKIKRKKITTVRELDAAFAASDRIKVKDPKAAAKWNPVKLAR
jgi:hypothetical protein